MPSSRFDWPGISSLIWNVLDKYGMTLQGLVFFGMHVKLGKRHIIV